MSSRSSASNAAAAAAAAAAAPDALFDHFLVVRLIEKPSPPSTQPPVVRRSQRPSLTSLFPLITYSYSSSAPSVSPYSPLVSAFCFPDLDCIRPTLDLHYLPEFFIFTLTESSGKKMYGYCKRYLPFGNG